MLFSSKYELDKGSEYKIFMGSKFIFCISYISQHTPPFMSVLKLIPHAKHLRIKVLELWKRDSLIGSFSYVMV